MVTERATELFTVSDADVLANTRPTVLVVDQYGDIVHAHGGSGRPLGYRPEQVIGYNGLKFIAPEDHPAMGVLYASGATTAIAESPEPFPLRIVGPDGDIDTWDCVPSGISRGDHGGWVTVLTRRSDQNVAIKAMEQFIVGGSTLDIAHAIAQHFNDGATDIYRKQALVLYRHQHPGGSTAHWSLLDPIEGTPIELTAGITSCMHDASAPWNTLAANSMVEVDDLPAELQRAAEAVDLPFCTVHTVGIDPERSPRSEIAFVRFASSDNTLEANNLLALRSVGVILSRSIAAEQSRELLAQAMRSDALTGVANRMRFDELLGAVEDASHHAVLFADIDQFKAVNDAYGHSVGDTTLCLVADRIVQACRPQDVVARIGGDEFAVILRDVTPADAQRIAQRVRASLSGISADPNDPTAVSVTVGVAEAQPGLSLAELVAKADHAMLASKVAHRSL